MIRQHRVALFLGSGAAAAALVAGCGSSTKSSAPAQSTAPASPAAPMSPAAPSSPPAPASPSAKPVLETAKAGNLGTIVTDSNGFTLYRFDHDSSNPSKATCTGSCATLWPPVAATGNVQVQGINQSLVSTVTRPDGTTQLTLNGWPLYRYAPDQKPGDTKGEGFMGIWFAATPTGGRAMAASSPSTGGSGGGGGGY